MESVFQQSNVKITRNKRYRELLRECYKYSRKSDHPSTHNAALLVDKSGKIVLKGLNILPPGVKKRKERYEEENKHKYLNHAERDVIYKAARKGIKTRGLTMVMPWFLAFHALMQS
jgi:dCMP deaminase